MSDRYLHDQDPSWEPLSQDWVGGLPVSSTPGDRPPITLDEPGLERLYQLTQQCAEEVLGERGYLLSTRIGERVRARALLEGL